MIIVKTPEQIEHIKSACGVVAKTLCEIKKHIKPGVATEELDKIVEEYVLGQGAELAFKGYRGYKYASCLSVNNEVVHGLPDERVLKDGDIIGVDVGAKVAGYYGDAAYTFAVGEVAAETLRLL
ncbi:MAG: M24 family metallopeptidase, partial [Candidatus Margulisbacteria bacterium]|nr:M24 family metallopeptidase [Candidatus Margulisiibacteriota bacterium]